MCVDTSGFIFLVFPNEVLIEPFKKLDGENVFYHVNANLGFDESISLEDDEANSVSTISA